MPSCHRFNIFDITVKYICLLGISADIVLLCISSENMRMYLKIHLYHIGFQFPCDIASKSIRKHGKIYSLGKICLLI